MFALLVLAATLSLGTADNGKTFTVAPKTAIVVTLPAEQDGGYVWRLKRMNKSVLRLVSHHSIPPKKGSPPGTSGTVRWRFAAVSAGTTRLRLVLIRPWLKHQEPARRFGVTISVS